MPKAAPKFGQASIFHGAGIQNHNGHLQAGRDIFINSHGPEARESVNLIHRKEVLNSLKFEQMGIRQQSVKRAHARTCQWLFDTDEYNEWLYSRQECACLWVKGKPGAGKSTLMKAALDHTCQIMKSAEPCILSFFFNARGSSLEKSTMGLYRSLLVQFLKTHPNSQHVLDNIEKGHPWSIESMKQAFENALNEPVHQQQLIIFLDAIDECNEQEARELFPWLEELSRGRRLHVCLASRHFPNITFPNITFDEIVLENRDEHIQDISLYIRDKLVFKDDRRLATHIRRDIQMKASGIFMWVVLVIDMLQREYDAGQKHKMLEKIRAFPKDLHELFRDICTQGGDPSPKLLLCLQWLLFAKHQLTPRQLYLAIISGTEPEDLVKCHSGDISDADVERYILDSSRGLAEIIISWRSSVQLIHESIKDFLLKENGLGTIWQDLNMCLQGRSHKALRECCSEYQVKAMGLILQDFSRPLTWQHQVANRKYPFLEYANDGVLFHANQAQTHGTCQKDFLRQFSTETWSRLQAVLDGHSTRSSRLNASLLYILAGKNYSALILASSLPTCFEEENSPQGTPVFRALAAGNYAALQALLDVFNQSRPLGEIAGFHRVHDLTVDYQKLTPERIRQFRFSRNRGVLSHLAELGCGRMLKTYLSSNRFSIDHMNLADPDGCTPLSYAARDGDIDTIRLLIERGAFVHHETQKRWTPLHLAVSRDHLEAAELLIEKGAKVNAKTDDGFTPLHIVMNERPFDKTKMAQLLIAKGADPGLTSNTVVNGDVKILKWLLDCGTDINATCDNGKTWLFMASESGHMESIRLLLQRGADINATCDNGKTCLLIASQSGHTDSIELLLDSGADINATCDNGKTCLFMASESGHMESIRLLLQRGADINATCHSKNTLLHAAASKGHVEIVQLLLDHGADVNARNTFGDKPVHRARKGGYTETISLLKACGADSNARNLHEQTPLQETCKIGGAEIVERELDLNAAANMKSIEGTTPPKTDSRNGKRPTTSFLADHHIHTTASSGDVIQPSCGKKRKRSD